VGEIIDDASLTRFYDVLRFAFLKSALPEKR
jgi:hypothetical protein